MSAPQQDDDASNQPTGWAGRARSFANLVSGLMFASVFLIFNYKIITRYLEHDEAVWADEVSVILFIWIIFWASAFLVRDKEQITFDLVYRHVGDNAKRWMALCRLVLVGGIFLWALPGSLDYIMFLWRERTPVLDWRLDYVYSCFGIFLVAVVVRSAFGIVKLLGPHWRRFI
ncbi:TRAP transporter small permease [Pseudolabrys taiwanensis]|uniref:TRAP transporter small permease protein n=1 Tax=Pseudolabrys taiwanensis TaxID=331696 RepID=A0A346A1F6_9HYPH|nr:TRAP transporter small permease subunit [Pseudolabrys taiwanensis]AXK83003.1 TRAP transporter small permease [Pseudolabrys taiwanensis]